MAPTFFLFLLGDRLTAADRWFGGSFFPLGFRISSRLGFNCGEEKGAQHIRHSMWSNHVVIVGTDEWHGMYERRPVFGGGSRKGLHTCSLLSGCAGLSSRLCVGALLRPSVPRLGAICGDEKGAHHVGQFLPANQIASNARSPSSNKPPKDRVQRVSWAVREVTRLVGRNSGRFTCLVLQVQRRVCLFLVWQVVLCLVLHLSTRDNCWETFGSTWYKNCHENWWMTP